MSAEMSESVTPSPPQRRSAADLRARIVKPKPIGLYLFLLLVVTIVPALGVTAFLLERNNESQRAVVDTLAEATAGSISQAVDRELSSMITTLRVLSTSGSLYGGQMDDFYLRAKSALADSGIYLVLLDNNLDTILDTRVLPGEEKGKVATPEAVQKALETKSVVISGLFYDEKETAWVFNVILPVFRFGKPPRILILTRDAADISNALSEPNLRGGWNASIIDRNGQVIASSFMSSATGKPFFLLPLEAGEQTRSGRVSGESPVETYKTVVKDSGFSGWHAVLWAPTTAVEEPMRRSLRTLVVGGLIVIAIGAAAAWLLGRQISRSVRRLAEDARRLGAGEPVQSIAYPIAEIATVSSALADAAIERKRAENEIRLLMREVAHRAKNQLTVVASIAKQSARSAKSLIGFQDAFQKRLYGLARSTDLLIAGGAAGVELRELLLAQIEPFKPDDPKRLDLAGPEFRLANQAAQSIGLAFHELATNASKYGAFAIAAGRLSLSWKIEGDKLEIVWREYVPRLRRRVRSRGFGTEIIERMLGGTLDAQIERMFHRDGLECVITIPIARLVPERHVTPVGST